MSTPLLQLHEICFAYDPHRPILRGLELTLQPGDRLGLCGPIGAGKTTVFMIAMGLLLPDQGRVVAFGKERRKERDFHEVRRRIGLLFQDPDDQLFCPTVREDLMFGPLNLGKSQEDATRIARRCLEQVGLPEMEERLTWQLSGGEKRLVALAAVLAMEPDALLLDEPTNDLDEASRERVIGVLRALPQAMIVISHDREAIGQLCARQLRLHEGVAVTPE